MAAKKKTASKTDAAAMTKADFIRQFATLSLDEVVAKGKEAKLTFTKKFVSTVRAKDKHRTRKSKRKTAAPAAAVSKVPLIRRVHEHVFMDSIDPIGLKRAKELLRIWEHEDEEKKKRIELALER